MASCAITLSACNERGDSAADDTASRGSRTAADAPTGRNWRKPHLIPRGLLFGDPQRIRGRLSPNGIMLAWLQPTDGALNIWVAPVDNLDAARPLTTGGDAGIRRYDWLGNNTHIIYMRGGEGGSPSRAYSVDVATGESIDLTPGGPDTRSRISAWSWDYPDDVVIMANDRDPDTFDLYRVNVATGAHALMFENSQGFLNFHVDHTLRLRLAETATPDGGRVLHVRKRNGDWRTLSTIEYADATATEIIDFDGTNASVYAFDSRGRDSAALVRIDIESGASTLIAALEGVDASKILLHPTTYDVDAVRVDRLSIEWLPLTANAASSLRIFNERLDGNATVLSRTVDDRLWIAYEDSPTNPGVYHLFDHDTGELQRLIDVRPDLAARRLAPMTPVIIKSRDGLDLVSYLTLPAGADMDGDGRPERRSPLVIIPQPAPWVRARLEFSPLHQWLADRGYAALSVNVRGAPGFGKAFMNAGDGEVGGRVQDDLVDAAAWAVTKNVAEPDAIASFGIWLGGHASLMTAVGQADTFACAASYDAPIDLVSVVENAPSYWGSYQHVLRRRLGDPSDPDVRAQMIARSPLTVAEEFAIPVFFAHGALDASQQIDAARLTAQRAYDAGAHVTFMEFPGDGGELDNPRDRIAFFAALEAFFGDCLGGRVDPIADDLANADIIVSVGIEHIPTLERALGRPSTDN